MVSAKTIAQAMSRLLIQFPDKAWTFKTRNLNAFYCKFWIKVSAICINVNAYQTYPNSAQALLQLSDVCTYDYRLYLNVHLSPYTKYILADVDHEGQWVYV